MGFANQTPAACRHVETVETVETVEAADRCYSSPIEMTIAPGLRLGPYEIIALIGAGGMGEVYRARDTRLDRTVAIKVLPASLSGNQQLRLRFEREAKAISALAHPNICTLYDVGSENGVEFLVMEHLDGETLADRLQRGPMAVEEVVRYAIEIADALDKAHRRGIVHRDLKPGNVMLTRDGAKLLDFGLARSFEIEAFSPDSLTVKAPTSPRPLTEEGTIVGTFQYMAPEQVEGHATDPRTDIFAFGALLYEMLTRKRAFSGKSRASIIASILAAEPQPLRALQPLTPAPLERIVRICLAKDPDERWQSAHDVRLELEGSLAAAGDSVSPKRHARWRLAGWIAAALVAAVAVGLAIVDRRLNHVRPRSIRFEIAPPAGGRFNAPDAPATLSPDGRRIVMAIIGGKYEGLWIRNLDSLDLVPLRGTKGAYDPFWSPDGREIGFFAEGKLKRVDPATLTVSTICSVGDSRAASWAPDGTIVFAPSRYGPLYRVDAKGGNPQPVTKLDAARKETGHWRPSFLPDGRRFLFLSESAASEQSGLYLGSLDSPAVRRVLDVVTPAVYAASGYLFYLNDHNLYAQPFDASAAKTKGDAILLAKNVEYTEEFASAGFSVSQNGVVVWHPSGDVPATALLRYPLGGGKPTAMSRGGRNLDLSRDGTRLAMERLETNQHNGDIWVDDLRRGISSRLTFDPGDEGGPVWSPDGRHIVYVEASSHGPSIRSRAVSGADEEVLFESKDVLGIEITDWSRDGKTLIGEQATLENRFDLVTFDLASRKLAKFVAGPFQEASARISPDGKWIAYTSDESGRNEIYVQPFPPDGSKWQVSSTGGDAPRWTGDGKTLFYVDLESMLLSVPVVTSGGFETGAPHAHVKIDTSDYVIRPDGSEAIVSKSDAPVEQPIVVVTSVVPER